jgi:dihydroflavonol-4-reductase
VKVLVTGATGFLGAHLCRRLAADGNDVSILLRSRSDPSRLDGLRVRRLVADVTDVVAVNAAVHGVDTVIHAAGAISYWMKDPQVLTDVNVVGVRNIARACRVGGVQRLLHVSSVAAIGIPDDDQPPANEQFEFNLGNAGLDYHVSKRRGEDALMEEVALGLNAVTVNPGWIFGPDGHSYRGWDMVRKVAGRRVIPFFHGGICAVHVEDVVNGIMLALEKAAPGSRFILGGENITYRALAERASHRLGSNARLVEVPESVTAIGAAALGLIARLSNSPPRLTRATHLTSRKRSFYSSEHARWSLGYKPRDFEAILDDMFRFAADHALLPRLIADVGMRGARPA